MAQLLELSAALLLSIVPVKNCGNARFCAEIAGAHTEKLHNISKELHHQSSVGPQIGQNRSHTYEYPLAPVFALVGNLFVAL